MDIQEWEPKSQPEEGVQYFIGIDFAVSSRNETFAYNVFKKEGDQMVIVDCGIKHNPRQPFSDNTYKHYKRLIEEAYSKFKKTITIIDK